MKTILTIAGSDSSGGAGIQADLKTFMAYGHYGMSVITSITAQNTTGVYGIMDVETDIVKKQLDCVFKDIYPDGIKIGMVSSKNIINVIADALEYYKPKNIVLDTIMVSTSGRELLKEDAKKDLMERLVPLASMITPNIPEAEEISGKTIKTKLDMKEAAERIREYYKGDILIKGGHMEKGAYDLLLTGREFFWFDGKYIETVNSHGTGCTLSSAIVSNLVSGYDSKTAVSRAKKYLTNALEYGLNLGRGNGPLNHMVNTY